MGKGFQLLLVLILCLFSIQTYICQKQTPFYGELVYSIERVDKKDSVQAEMIIYARDSLLRVVNFSSESGKQELIKNLRLGKSYLLFETPKQKFAIRTNEHLKIKVKQREIKNELSFYIYKKIAAKYANAFINLPGLPVIYYIPTDHGLYKYVLKSIKQTEPPLQLFTFGKDYKIVTFEEFSEEFSRLYESEE